MSRCPRRRRIRGRPGLGSLWIRTRKLESWQQIRLTRRRWGSCDTGSCSSSSACRLNQQTGNPHCRKHMLQSWPKTRPTQSRWGLESTCCSTTCKIGIVHNPHCRKHTLQSWQQIHQTLCMERACCIGSLTACKTFPWNQRTGNPHCRTRRLRNWPRSRR